MGCGCGQPTNNGGGIHRKIVHGMGIYDLFGDSYIRELSVLERDRYESARALTAQQLAASRPKNGQKSSRLVEKLCSTFLLLFCFLLLSELETTWFSPIYVRNVEKYVRDRNACHSPSMRHIVNVRQIHIHTAHICILYATFTDFTRATKKHIARQSRLEKISNDFELLGKIPVDR